MIIHGVIPKWIRGTPPLHVHFDYEHAVLLEANGAEARKWIRRIRWLGPWLILLWIAITHRAVPSDKGLAVWDKKGCYRLGELAMLVKTKWPHVSVIWLQSSRQKAWLHGVEFPLRLEVTTINQDEIGRGVE